MQQQRTVAPTVSPAWSNAPLERVPMQAVNFGDAQHFQNAGVFVHWVNKYEKPKSASTQDTQADLLAFLI